jgi:hypothetical protein
MSRLNPNWPYAVALTAIALTAIAPPSFSAQHAHDDVRAPAIQLPNWSGAWIIPEAAFVVSVLREQNPDDPLAPSLTRAYHQALLAGNARRLKGIDAEAESLRTNAEKCLSPGMPDIMRYPVAIEFLFTPGRVTILSEEGPAIRRIYTDGRTHAPDAEPTLLGESIAHWEGTTLVIDTTAISDQSQLIGPVKTSGSAHITERIHLHDSAHLQIDTQVEDAIALQTPWRYRRIYERLNSGFIEMNCLQNNRDRGSGDPDLTPPP